MIFPGLPGQIVVPRSAPVWHNVRVGKLTASNMWKAFDVTKRHDPSAERKRYMIELVAERMEDAIIPHYVTPAMQDGIDRQPLAIADYEAVTGEIVGGEYLFVHPTIENFAATPDALIGDDAILEVKCPTLYTHTEYLARREIPVQHQYQMTAQLLCTGRRSAVWMSWYPSRSEATRRIMLPFEPPEDILEKVEAGAVQFLAEVEDLFDRVTGG